MFKLIKHLSSKSGSICLSLLELLHFLNLYVLPQIYPLISVLLQFTDQLLVECFSCATINNASFVFECCLYVLRRLKNPENKNTGQQKEALEKYMPLNLFIQSNQTISAQCFSTLRFHSLLGVIVEFVFDNKLAFCKLLLTHSANRLQLT